MHELCGIPKMHNAIMRKHHKSQIKVIQQIINWFFFLSQRYETAKIEELFQRALRGCVSHVGWILDQEKIYKYILRHFYMYNDISRINDTV